MINFTQKKLLEIVWLSRGGQGAKTAALLFGEAALNCGYYIQAFPEYGPERSGAPMRVYNRISSKFIRFRTPIESPDIVIVLDTTLLRDISFPISSQTIFLINSKKSSETLKVEFKIKSRILTIDASQISLKFLGKSIPSIVMLGALMGLLNFDFQKIKPKLEHRLFEKIGTELVSENIKAIAEAYKIINSNKVI